MNDNEGNFKLFAITYSEFLCQTNTLAYSACASITGYGRKKLCSIGPCARKKGNKNEVFLN
jgi:hypothetical protein